jgi:3-(3-hydroxy-phenyl)propionate hydroxylase
MAHLITRPNIARADDIYQRLIEMTEGLNETEALRVSARLILTLINHIGDSEVIFQALALARCASDGSVELATARP